MQGLAKTFSAAEDGLFWSNGAAALAEIIPQSARVGIQEGCNISRYAQLL